MAKNLASVEGSHFSSHEENKACVLGDYSLSWYNSFYICPRLSIIILFKVMEYQLMGVNALVLRRKNVRTFKGLKKMLLSQNFFISKFIQEMFLNILLQTTCA